MEYHVPLSRELLNVFDWAKVDNISICYVFQKQDKADFRYPYQGKYMSETLGNHGYRIKFSNSPPSRTYVPLTESVLDVTKTTDLIRYVLKRVLSNIRKKFIPLS